MLMYCKKCGRIWTKFGNEKDNCDVCNSICYLIPNQYLLVRDDEIRDIIDKSKKDQFIEECIKSSSEFDEELFNSRDEILARKNAEYEQQMAIGDAIRNGADVKTAFRNGGQNMPKCPTCGSLNVEKISTGKKVFGGAMFGLFSSDVRNTMHCKNCGYKW